MFPLNSWVSVRAYGGIRAQITDSVAHLLSESTVLKTKVACGHVQWYDNSMKWETHFKRETLSSAERGFHVYRLMLQHIEDVKGKSRDKSKDVLYIQPNDQWEQEKQQYSRKTFLWENWVEWLAVEQHYK